MRLVAVVLTLAATMLAGCAGQDRPSGMGFVGAPLESEEASYEFSIDGEPRGSLQLFYERVEGDLHLALAWQIDGEEKTATAIVDAATLELRLVHRDSTDQYAWGMGRWVAHTHLASPTNLGDVRTIIPVGLQRFATPVEEGWSVELTIDCAWQCGYNQEQPAPITTTASGMSGAFLPDAYSVAFGAWRFDANRSNAALTNGEELHVSDPSVEPPVASTARCGFAPCEPADWPIALSFQAALEALEQNPDWLAWNDGTVLPWHFVLFGPQFIDGDPLLFDDSVNWAYRFDKDGDRRIYWARAVENPLDGGHGPPVVHDWGESSGSGEQPGAWDLGLLDLDQVLMPWLDRVGADRGQVVLLTLTNYPERFHPDVRARVMLHVGIETSDGRLYLDGSLVDGQMMLSRVG